MRMQLVRVAEDVFDNEKAGNAVEEEVDDEYGS